MELILITGLPGSGKTHYANELLSSYTKNNLNVLLTSDPLTPQDIQDEVIKVKRWPYDIWIIETPYLCTVQDQIMFNSSPVMKLDSITNVKWIMFENNPSQCLENIKNRNDSRPVLDTLYNYSKNYNIIENAKVIPVWTNQKSLELDL